MKSSNQSPEQDMYEQNLHSPQTPNVEYFSSSETTQDMHEQNQHSPQTPNVEYFSPSDKVVEKSGDLYVYDSNSFFGAAYAKKLRFSPELSADSELTADGASSPVSISGLESPFFEILCQAGWGVFKSISAVAIDSLGMSPTPSDSK